MKHNETGQSHTCLGRIIDQVGWGKAWGPNGLSLCRDNIHARRFGHAGSAKGDLPGTRSPVLIATT